MSDMKFILVIFCEQCPRLISCYFCHYYASFPRRAFSSSSGGICAKIIAVNISTQPISSLPVIRSLRKSAPEMAAKTDSSDISSDATVGSVFLCPMICKVYATPHERNDDSIVFDDAGHFIQRRAESGGLGRDDHEIGLCHAAACGNVLIVFPHAVEHGDDHAGLFYSGI